MIDKQAATKIISDTFEKTFDKGRFAYFAKNLLNKIDESKVLHLQGAYIPESFREFVKTYERLGTYTDPEGQKLDILIVYLQKETSLERARTAQRNFVARYLKERGEKEAGLVAFVSLEPGDWRFSFVKMEYRLEETPQGKTKVKEELTPARRLSFLVGENESSHTAQKQLFPILEDDKRNPTLSELEKAFSVEVVTKEFFGKYRELYLDVMESLDSLVENDKVIRKDFAAKGVNTVDFSKKLLGQIVFLYFLQKKGWFGVARDAEWGTGSKQFLREFFEGKHGTYKNFFNDILEPLFYEALRIDRSHDDDYYSKFNCKIPFLNGGLFDPINNYDWVHTDIILPNGLFSNSEKTKEGDTGTGILDVFDRYNFTVKEDEPLDKEVAIDPEMLGKVFENLLEVKDRKSKGTYYTPREIVHYMCQESLINYLDTAVNTGEVPLSRTKPPQGKLIGEPDPEQMSLKTTAYKPIVPRQDIEDFVRKGELAIEHDSRVETFGRETKTYSYRISESIRSIARIIDDKLGTIRVCDPAVGSGAFLVGMMHEIVKCRKVLSTYLGEEEGRRVYDFKRHAIQSCLYGVDIDPGAVEIAKLRLWLSLVVDEEDIRQIKPLPNLDYKIVCGNSLLGVEKTLFNLDLFKELEILKPLYFDETNAKKKQECKGHIDQLIKQITNNNENFDFQVYFSEVFHKKDGFDVVIANPPYVGESGHKELFRMTKEGPLGQFYLGKMDYFYFFLHLALNLARGNGEVAFITTNYYLTATGAKKLRDDYKHRATVRSLINFNELRIFESAQGQHNLITLLKKWRNEETQARTCITRRNGFATPEMLSQILSWGDSESSYFTIRQEDLYNGSENYIRIDRECVTSVSVNVNINSILDNLARGYELMERIANIDQGVVSGCDYVSNRNIDKLAAHADVENGDGIFVYDLDNPRDREVISGFNEFERSLLRRFFKNSDIRRYWCSNHATKRLLYIGREIHSLTDSPNVAAHLKKFKAILSHRREVENGRIKYFQLQWPRTESIFIGEKIVVPYRSESNSFAYDCGEWFCRSDCYVITQKSAAYDLKYLLALLNSRLYFQWLYHRGKRKGEMLELFQVPLSEIPIKSIVKDRQESFISLADKILAAKQRDPESDTTALEHQIDQLVYQLYELTPEEIAVVEGSIRDKA